MSTRMPRQTIEQSQTQTEIIVMSSAPQREKWKRGQRMRNKFPKGQTIVVEVVIPIGEPIQPDGICSGTFWKHNRSGGLGHFGLLNIALEHCAQK